MTLTLRIENFDVMDNGGPMSITLRGHGCTAGRGNGMDWQLPDPARHVSSHHFDISFAGGQYYLTDVSTNGTFLQGQSFRLDGAHPIAPGDRFVVGPYLIGVQLDVAASPAPQPAPMQTPPAAAVDDDPWAAFAPAPAQPVNPLPAAPAPAQDIGQQRIDLGPPPPINPQGGAPTPAPAPPAAAPPSPAARPSGLSMPPGPPPPAPSGPPQRQPAAPPSIPPGLSMPPLTTPPLSGGGLSTPPRPAPLSAPQPPPEPSAPAPEPVPMPSPDAPKPAASSPATPPPSPFSQAGLGSYAPASGAPAPTAADPAGQEAILRAFCEGAGLSFEAHANTDTVALAAELGRVVRLATTDIMAMLTDRAAVKQFTKGGERTMRSAKGNNPMKFLPDPEQAIEAMFLRPRDGFMRGTDGFSNALRDVRSHQAAVFAALQPALAHVLSGLSPDEIQGNTSPGLLGGSGKSKSWDTYVARWDEKAEKGDHGMLDSFLEAFATAYAQAVARDDP